MAKPDENTTAADWLMMRDNLAQAIAGAETMKTAFGVPVRDHPNEVELCDRELAERLLNMGLIDLEMVVEE